MRYRGVIRAPCGFYKSDLTMLQKRYEGVIQTILGWTFRGYTTVLKMLCERFHYKGATWVSYDRFVGATRTRWRWYGCIIRVSYERVAGAMLWACYKCCIRVSYECIVGAVRTHCERFRNVTRTLWRCYQSAIMSWEPFVVIYKRFASVKHVL